jgi:hypothetical protein
MNEPPKIQSVGVPPERHAYRVVGEMCQWLFREEVRLDQLMADKIKVRRGGLGNPIAQQRFVDRVRKLGSKAIIDLQFAPGKRGKFRMAWTSWTVVSPETGASFFGTDQPIPERPWLACDVSVFDGRSQDRNEDFRVFTLTHHAMQRLAERCNARTPDDLLDALKELWPQLNTILNEVSADQEWQKLKATTLKLPVAGGIAIIEFSPGFSWVVKTVLDTNMVEPALDKDASGSEG